MKPEIRVLGVDDSPFKKFQKRKQTRIIGTIFRGGNFLDGILSTKVSIDGNNSTDKLIELINNTKFKPQLRCLMLDGIAFGGFNIIDIHKLHKKTKIPVMVIMRKMPDMKAIEKALKKIKKHKKLKLIEKAGPPIKIGNIYAQFKGLSKKQAEEILKITCTHSYIPEPIRVSHLIAQGVYFGESKGKA